MGMICARETFDAAFVQMCEIEGLKMRECSEFRIHMYHCFKDDISIALGATSEL